MKNTIRVFHYNYYYPPPLQQYLFFHSTVQDKSKCRWRSCSCQAVPPPSERIQNFENEKRLVSPAPFKTKNRCWFANWCIRVYWRKRIQNCYTSVQSLNRWPQRSWCSEINDVDWYSNPNRTHRTRLQAWSARGIHLRIISSEMNQCFTRMSRPSRRTCNGLFAWLPRHAVFVVASVVRRKRGPTLPHRTSHFEKIRYLLEFECDKQNKVISEKEAEDVLVKYLGLVRSNQCTVCRDMYRYWVAKRTRNQKPLLRRFWPITQPTDPDPHMVLRPRDEQGMKNRLRRSRKDDKSSYDKLKLIQQDLEQVTRMLKCLQRELFKASKLKYEEQLFRRAYSTRSMQRIQRGQRYWKNDNDCYWRARGWIYSPTFLLPIRWWSLNSFADGVGSPRSTGDLTPKVSNTSVHKT